MKTENDTFAIVEAAHQRYAIPTSVVREFIDMEGVRISSMPGCRPPCTGIIRHRESVLLIVDVRAMLGYPTFEESMAELTELLAARERDHVGWLNELQRCCETGAEFTKATDPTKCAFGKWYDALRANQELMNNLTDGDPGVTHIINAFDEPHRRIHGIAEKALGAARQNRLDEAKGIITNAWDNELATMKRLFKQLVDTIRMRRRSRVVVVELNGEHVALQTDAILAIADAKADELHAIDDQTMGQTLIESVYTSEQFGEVCVIDIAKVGGLLESNKSGGAAASEAGPGEAAGDSPALAA